MKCKLAHVDNTRHGNSPTGVAECYTSEEALKKPIATHWWFAGKEIEIESLAVVDILK